MHDHMHIVYIQHFNYNLSIYTYNIYTPIDIQEKMQIWIRE
jgi:hypothetical protein